MSTVRPVSLSAFILLIFVAAPAEDVNVTGAWEISLETGQGTATPSMTLRQDRETLTGTYKGRLGESKLEGTLKGRSIKFTVNLKFRDQPVTVTYEGTVDNDTMKGSATFGDRGSANWTAKRRP